MAASEKTLVTVRTSVTGYEQWCYSLQLPKSATVQILKTLLIHVVHITKETLVLSSNGLQPLADSALVPPEVVLKDVVPGIGFKPPTRKAPPPTAGSNRGNKPQPPQMATKQDHEMLYTRIEELEKGHHGLPMGERRLHAYHHYMAQMHGFMMTQGHARRGTEQRPFVWWVLNCRNEVEVSLAKDGYFDNANYVDRAPVDVVLLGEDIARFQSGPDTATAGQPPRISCLPYSAVGETSGKPDVAIVFHPEFEAKEDHRMVMKPSIFPQSARQGLPETLVVFFMSRFRPAEEDIRALRERHRELRMVHVNDNRVASVPLESLKNLDFAEHGWMIGPVTLRALDVFLRHEWVMPGPYSREKPDPENKTPALFWGILDLKFEFTRPPAERIAILETGDGRSSRFSNDGAPILQAWKERFKLDDNALVGKHAVVSSNKKLTHDLIETYGYGHLLPNQMCLPMMYNADLAVTILEGLQITDLESSIVVLKLHNRARGAGVLPVPAQELDEVLKDVLTPPTDLEQWFKTKMAEMGEKSVPAVHWGDYEEEIRHWWSCECPYFIVERYAPSTPMEMAGELYDGTLRVAFALRLRHPNLKRKPTEKKTDLLTEDCAPPEDIAIDWLGGYWKMPKDPLSSPELRRRVVSAARTSGTAIVDPTHLLEVYAALADLVPKLFGGTEPSMSSLAERYKGQPEFGSYLLARLAISMPEFGTAKIALKRADKLLAEAPDGLLKRISGSFIQRGFGIIEAMKPPGFWNAAQEFFNQSIKHFPYNATTLCQLGMAAMEGGRYDEAVGLFTKSMLLDLDYRAPYVNLGVTYLRQKKFLPAIEVSEAGFARHNESPQCLYHIGVASYQLACALEEAGSTQPNVELSRLKSRAHECLVQARDHEEGRRLQTRGIRGGPGGVDPPWTAADDEMLASLTNKGAKLKPVKITEESGMRFFSWRN